MPAPTSGTGCEPITANNVAEMLQAVGVNHVITIDLHAPQIEGFFHIPADSLTAVPLVCEAIRPQLPVGSQQMNLEVKQITTR